MPSRKQRTLNVRKSSMWPIAVGAVLFCANQSPVDALKTNKKVALHASITNYTCSGEYEQCPSTGECVMLAADCGTCGASGFGLYLCPDRQNCVADAADCPALAGTFWDWTLSTDDRVSLILQQLNETDIIQQLQNSAPSIPHLNIPAFQWLVDDVHGVNRPRATSFPSGVTLGNTWSHRYTSLMAETMTREARALHRYNIQRGNRAVKPEVNGQGITFYGPNINLVRDPRWGRNQEVYSEDPFLTGRLTQVVVRTVQSKNFNAQPNKIPQGGTKPAPSTYSIKSALACCKHYAAYNVENFPTSRHEYDAVVGARDMWETYLPHFEMCSGAKSSTPDSHGDIWDPAAHAMCSYNRVNGVPACGNEELLNGVLRGKFGFEGFVVSDYDAWADIYNSQKYCPNMTCAAAAGLNAGCDQEGGGNSAIDSLADAINQGMTTMSKVETAARRLFTARVELGVFDPPSLAPAVTAVPFSAICTDDHLRLSLRSAEAGIVLLKNRLTDDTFKNIKASKSRKSKPTKKWSPSGRNYTPTKARDPATVSSIAVIGPTASATTWLQGNYDKPPAWGVVSILEGLYHSACKDLNEGTELVGQQAAGVDFRGGQASDTNVSVAASSLAQCVTKCEADLSCNYYTFDSTQNLCYFLRDTTTQITAAATITSGSRGGLAIMNYGYTTADFLKDTPSFPPPIDERECSIRCLADPKCDFFVFTSSSIFNLCYLRPSGQKVVDPNSVWGASPNKCRDVASQTPLHVVNFQPACLDSLQCTTAQQANGILFSDALAAADASDMIVVVGGLDQTMESEGNDRTTIDLPANQTLYINTLAQHVSSSGKPLVAVFVHGGTFVLPASTQIDAKAGEDYSAVFSAGYPSQMGGYAFANLLFRKTCPAAKTAASWYKSSNDLPYDLSHESFYPNSSVPNANGYTYRYFKPDSAPSDRFAVDFGYGLSYTSFSFSVSDVPDGGIVINPCDTIHITVNVQNTGNVTGSAVAQVYTDRPTGDDVSNYPMPILRLVDFFRFEDILPGYIATKVLTVEPMFMTTVIDNNDPMANPNIYNGTRMIFPSQFNVFIGPSQPTTIGWKEASGAQIPIKISGNSGVNYDTQCKKSPSRV